MTIAESDLSPTFELSDALEFLGRTMGDAGGLAATLLWALADELGLLAALLDKPSTADVLATTVGADPRSVLEVLRGLTAAGYICQESSGRFAIPAAHGAVLVDGSPMSCAGAVQEMAAIAAMWPHVTEACRVGHGIDPSAYPPGMAQGMERLGAPSYEGALPNQWVPEVPGLAERLTTGATVADIGCGRGRALLGLANAYPGVSGIGFDLSDGNLEAAAAAAEARTLADRISFRRLDAGDGVPGTFDLVLAFDVLHDAGDPVAMAAGLRQATADTGVLLVLEPASADDPAENVGPMATLLHLFSVGYCLQVATHAGSARLGTAGLPESKLRSLLVGAGFFSVRRLTIEAGFNACYEVRPYAPL